MPNSSANLGFNIFLETDVVDFDDINENFNKLDGYNLCIESGTKTSSYTGGSTNIATWRYKKYADNTVEMSTKLEFTNLKCNGGTDSPYYSGTSNLYFPFQFTSVYDVQMHLASNTIGWVSNITGPAVLDKVMFRVMSTHYESDYEYKQVFINVKGVIG